MGIIASVARALVGVTAKSTEKLAELTLPSPSGVTLKVTQAVLPKAGEAMADVTTDVIKGAASIPLTTSNEIGRETLAAAKSAISGGPAGGKTPIMGPGGQITFNS